jgi:hypothetical protein
MIFKIKSLKQSQINLNNETIFVNFNDNFVNLFLQ